MMKYLVTIEIECESASAYFAIEECVDRIKTEETEVTAKCLSTGEETSVTVLSFDGHLATNVAVKCPECGSQKIDDIDADSLFCGDCGNEVG